MSLCSRRTRLLALNDSGSAFKASSNDGIPPLPPAPGVPGTELPGDDFAAGVEILAGFLTPALGAGFDFDVNAASSSLFFKGRSAAGGRPPKYVIGDVNVIAGRTE